MIIKTTPKAMLYKLVKRSLTTKELSVTEFNTSLTLLDLLIYEVYFSKSNRILSYWIPHIIRVSGAGTFESDFITMQARRELEKTAPEAQQIENISFSKC